MKSVKGDLLQLALQGKFHVIVHGCNCQCQMGKGIALSIKRQVPQAPTRTTRMPNSRIER